MLSIYLKESRFKLNFINLLENLIEKKELTRVTLSI